MNGEDYEFFLHPPNANYEVIGEPNNEIFIHAVNYPARTYLEMNLLLSKGQFSNLYPAKNYLTKEEIISGEKNYIQKEKSNQSLLQILAFLPLFILCSSFIILYFLYGREKPLSSLSYNAIYEREPPKNTTPAVAGYIVSKTQSPALISAELMMLWHLGFLEIEQKRTTNKVLFFDFSSEQSFIKINNSKSDSSLAPHQKSILDVLKKIELYAKERKKMQDGAFSTSLFRDFFQTRSPLFYSNFFEIIQKKFNLYLNIRICLIQRPLKLGAICFHTVIAHLRIFFCHPCRVPPNTRQMD
jgi:uncharacterized membrane protein